METAGRCISVSDESSLGRFGEQVAFYPIKKKKKKRCILCGFKLKSSALDPIWYECGHNVQILSCVYIVYCPMHWMEDLPLKQTVTSISIVDMSIKCQDQNNIVLTQKRRKYSLFSFFYFLLFFHIFLSPHCWITSDIAICHHLRPPSSV